MLRNLSSTNQRCASTSGKIALWIWQSLNLHYFYKEQVKWEMAQSIASVSLQQDSKVKRRMSALHTNIIDHSPLGLFRANETNNWNKLNRLRISTGRRQTSWLCTMQLRSWTRDYLEQIQLVVRVGPELGIFRFQIWRHNYFATLPPFSLWSLLISSAG